MSAPRATSLGLTARPLFASGQQGRLVRLSSHTTPQYFNRNDEGALRARARISCCLVHQSKSLDEHPRTAGGRAVGQVAAERVPKIFHDRRRDRLTSGHAPDEFLEQLLSLAWVRRPIANQRDQMGNLTRGHPLSHGAPSVGFSDPSLQ